MESLRVCTWRDGLRWRVRGHTGGWMRIVVSLVVFAINVVSWVAVLVLHIMVDEHGMWF